MSDSDALGWVAHNTKGLVPLEKLSAPANITGIWKSTGPQWTAEISWDKSEGATYYNVQYRTPKTNNQWKKDSDYSSGNRYISTGLKDYPYYEYRVQAVNPRSVSGWKYYTLKKPTTVTPPAKPEKVSAGWTSSGKKTGPRLFWPAVSGAEYYRVQYKKSTGNNWSSAITVKSGTSYTFSDLSADTSWDFRVEAVNAAGPSGWVECSLLTPADIVADLIKKEPAIDPSVTVDAPSGVSAEWKSTGGSAAAELTWNAVSNVDHYEVGYKKDGGNWETIPVCILSPNTSHVFDKLDSGLSYSLRVKAVKSGVSSAWAECTIAKSETTVKLASPTGVSGTWTSTGPQWTARISWDAVSGATRYEVQYRTPKTNNQWKADPDYSSGTSYISTGLKDYDSYDYRVRAVNASGPSDWTEYKLEKKAATSTVPPVQGSYQIPSVYIQQADGDGCYVASAAMVISNYRLLNGGSAITYAEAKTANGNRTYFDWGTFGKYGLKDVDLWTSANSHLSGSAREQMVITALGKNNYGAMLCFRGKGKSHAVVVVGYENGSIIVNDPARGGLGGERIKLTDCSYIRSNITGYVSQEQMLTCANSLTYFVANGTPGNDAGKKPEDSTKPAAPSGVSGSWKSTGPNWTAMVSWNPVSGATRYEVQYRTPKTGNAWRADPDYSSGTSYISTGLKDYNSYDYRVRACNSAGESDWATYTLVKPAAPTPPSPPNAPSGVSGSWTSTGPDWTARISWNAVSGATRYEVQYRTPKTGNAWRADPDYSSGTSYISTGLKDYSSYDYRVRAYNDSGASAWATYTLVKTVSTPEPTPAPTTPTPTPPSAPNGVSGFWTSTGPKWQAQISWNTVSGTTYYEVQYRTPKTGNAWRTDPDYSSGTSYISTGLMDYNSYDYRVRACNSSGASAWTTYTLVKTVSTPELVPAPTPSEPTPTLPSAPSGVSGIWTSTGPTWQARISWNAVSDATHYEVQYRTAKTGNEWRADPDYSSGTSYISTGLKDYSSYDYRIRAVNANGASGWTEYTLYK